MGSSPGVFRPSYKNPAGESVLTDTWAYQVWDPAARKRRKVYGFATAAEAKKARAVAQSQAKRGAGATAGNLTLRQMLDLVIADQEIEGRRSVEQTRQVANRLCKLLKDAHPVRLLDSQAVDGLKADLAGRGLKAPTINGYLRVLKRGFTLARRRHPALAPPYIALLDEAQNIRHGVIDPADLEAIIAHMPAHLHSAVRAIHLTGWRTMEPLRRRWADIVDGFLVLSAQDSKSKQPRLYPIDGLSPIIGEQPDGAVYIFGDGQTPFTYWQLYGAWKRARIVAGFPKLNLHDLRRTAARDLIRAGVDRDTARRMLGHETDSIFSRYRIVEGADMKSAATRLKEYRLEQAENGSGAD